MDKCCQCCGVLLNENNLGTEKDGSKVYEYCKGCYLNGEFIKKDIFNVDIKEIDKFRVSKFKNWIMRKYYVMQLKRVSTIKNRGN